VNWLDWTILLWLAWGAIRGLRRGIAIVFVGLAGFLLSVAAAFVACPRLVAYLQERYGLVDAAAASLQRYLPLPVPTLAIRLEGSSPEELRTALADLPVSGWLRGLLLDHGPEVAALGTEKGLESVGDVVYHLLGSYLVAVAVFVGVFLVARLLLGWLGGALGDALTAVPVVGPLARLAGGVLGAAEQGLVVVVVLGLASAASSLAPFLGPPVQASRLAPTALELFRRLLPMAPTLQGLLGR